MLLNPFPNHLRANTRRGPSHLQLEINEMVVFKQVFISDAAVDGHMNRGCWACMPLRRSMLRLFTR